MKTSDKILIIGFGSIGKRHSKNLIILGYKNIALCDPKIHELEKIPQGFPKYTNHLEALKSENPKVCFICSPTNLHLKHLNDCINFDSDVFVEKPLSFSTKGIDKVIFLAKKKSKKVMVACNWRFNETFLELKKIIAKKKYGEVYFANVEVKYYLPEAREGTDWRNTYAVKKIGGGVTLDTGSHVFNYLQDLFGKIKITKIFRSHLHPLKTQVDEMVIAFLEHKNKISSSVYMDFVTKDPAHLIRINTKEGTLVADMKSNKISFRSKGTEKIIFQGRKDFNEMFLAELKHFFRALEEKVDVLQPLTEARSVIKLLTQ